MATHTYGVGPIKGYEVGPIPMEAAFTSDFPLAQGVGVQEIVDKQEVERRVMDVRPGMYAKYMPSRIEEGGAGTHFTGGRYLFETWDDVLDYERFTSEELEFEPGVKFWSRPFFLNVERFVWRVAGAHNFLPLEEHHVSRFERFRYEGDADLAVERAWASLRDEAEARGLGAVWLLHQPEQRLIGIHSVASREASAGLEAEVSLGSLLPESLAAERYFDRTSRILSLWLPKSRLAGGVPSAYPMSPPLPLPTVPVQVPAA
ncbi:hypothetical protein [Streptomyces aureoverticillatus]|uniref:hypothetical protein n=1 Tax=Streptomyces aureoverticillatus TaxID=66871 RepID=UPI0013DA4FC7|nr:hypothetical protein [Streptomyces aureoverticillatus]QIB44433.1 hypothetical protein G3H79_16425 [Streptomyces aureoverticillatus]